MDYTDYDQIARGYQERALGGGVGFGDSGAVARGHMHWDSQKESDGDSANAEAYTDLPLQISSTWS